MPTYILKPHKDLDFYVEWSTIVDNPVMIGSRAELLAEPDEPGIEATSWLAMQYRLHRADTNGTSALVGPPFFGWDTETLIVEDGHLKTHRLLRRSRMAAYSILLAIDDVAGASSLTDPIEESETLPAAAAELAVAS